MKISEMHVWFRQYAQQMGMQNVRAILPEQIDLLINTSITDTINQIIKENIGVTNDRVITDNSKVGQINALQTLYKVKLIDMSPAANIDNETRAFAFHAADRLTGRMTTDFTKLDNTKVIPDYLFLVDFSLNYKKTANNDGYNGINNITTINNTYSVLTPIGCISDNKTYTRTDISLEGNHNFSVECYDGDDLTRHTFTPEDVDSDNPKLVCRDGSNKVGYYLGVKAITSDAYAYKEAKYIITDSLDQANIYNPLVVHKYAERSTYVQPKFEVDGLETNYFPVRLIDDIYLADTLNDFVLKNRLRSPIIVTYNNGTFDLYIDKFQKVINSAGDTKYILENNLLPYKLRMSYISKPATVRYAEDIDGQNVDCDLPEYMHVDILKHAVDLYRIAVSGSLHAAQQQDQAAQQENVRNNYRNEGNQTN